MNEYLSLFQQWLELNPQWLGLSILVIAFVESLAIAGIIVPGVALLFLTATLAGGGALSLPETLLCAFIGAVAGDGLSFAIGRIFQTRIPTLWPFSHYPKVMAMGQQFFLRHGGKSIIFGRFIGPVRPVVPLIAGMMNMPSGRYLACNLLSAFAWAPFYILPGYLIGASLQTQVSLPPHFWWMLIPSLVIAGGILWLFVHLQARLQYESNLYRKLESRLKRYNQAHHFWRIFSNQRPHHAGEFPLNSLFLFTLSAVLFLILSLIVTTTPWLTPLNNATAEFFQALRHPWIDRVFIAFTLAGDPEIYYVGFVIACLLLWFKGHPAAVTHVVIGGVLTLVFTHALKAFFAIPRPDIAITPPTSFAFPSGHASGTTIFYGLLASFIAQELSRPTRRLVYLAAAIPILLITLSRVYLGVHWLSDVVGGILFGLMLCGAVRISFSRYDRNPITPGSFVWGALALFISVNALYIHQQLPEATDRYAARSTAAQDYSNSPSKL